MPIEVCTLEGSPGYRWGSSGKCYTYEPGDAGARERAREAAERQGRAARAAGYGNVSSGPIAARRGALTLLAGVGALQVIVDKQAVTLTPEKALELLREVQREAGDIVDAAYQKVVVTAIRQATARPISTAARAEEAARHVQKAVSTFLGSKELEAITRETVRAAYSYGVLYVWNRFEQIQAKGKTPARVDMTIRPVSKAKTSSMATIAGAVNLTLEDERAVEGVYQSSFKAWVTSDTGVKYMTPEVRQELRERAKELAGTGQPADKIGEKLRAQMDAIFGVGEFTTRSRTYWGGVVEHIASEAGIRGQFEEAHRLGFTRYEIINPMDERTTPFCSMMNGKTVFIADARSMFNNLDAAKTSDEIKAVKPFVSGGKVDPAKSAVPAITAGPMSLNSAQSKALADAGIAAPPYHFRCRTFIDVYYEEGSPPVPKVAPIPPAERIPGIPAPPVGFPHRLEDCKVSPMKLGGANKKFVVEAPDGSLWMFKDYSAMSSEYRAAVDELAAIIQKAAGVPTPDVHTVTFSRDWIGWRGSSEVARKTTGSITRLFGPDEVASFDIGGGRAGLNLETLAKAQIRDVQIDHAVNWMISNGDAHYENFIMLKNGRVVGIDKGQGFKFFGKDKLEWNYRSPQAPMPSTNGYAYAESQLTRYAEGQMPKNFTFEGIYDSKGGLTELGKAIQQMQNIPDAEFARVLRPYAEAMEKQGRGVFARGADKGLQEVLDRKNALVKDFDNLYKRLEAARRESLGIFTDLQGQTALSPSAEMLARRNLWGNGEEVLRNVEAAKVPGYTVFVGSNAAVEDGFLHGVRYGRQGGTGARAAQYQFRGKLRPAVSQNFKATLDSIIAGSPRPSMALGAKTNEEIIEAARQRIASWWSGSYETGDEGVFRFIKSFNARFDAAQGHSLLGSPMGKYDQVYDKLITQFEQLSKLKTPAARLAAEETLGYRVTAAEVNVADDYLKMLRRYKNADGTWNADNVASKVGQAVQPETPAIRLGRVPKAPVEAAPESQAVAPPRVRKMTANEGPIENHGVGPKGTTIKTEFGTKDTRDAVVGHLYDALPSFSTGADGYVIEHGSNPAVSVRYFSQSGSMHVYRGEFRIVIDKAAPTLADLEDARQLLSQLGVNLKPTGASVEEMKVVWARKQARAVGLDLDASTSSFFSQVSESLPPEEQLQRLSQAFDSAAQKVSNPRLAWKTLTRGMTEEDFLPTFTNHTIANGVQNPSGFPLWTRRDFTVQELKDAGIQGAFSSITGNSAGELVKIMADSENVAFLSTAERARAGVPWWGGMSPAADMGTGGADYVFTRLNTGTNLQMLTNIEGVSSKIARKEFNPAIDRANLTTGIYWRREALLNADAIFYGRDLFGQVDTLSFVNTNMVKTIAPPNANPAKHLAAEMVGHKNEFIPKRELGFNNGIDHWVVGSFRERTAAIEALKEKGVTALGGRPVEEVFIVSY